MIPAKTCIQRSANSIHSFISGLIISSVRSSAEAARQGAGVYSVGQDFSAPASHIRAKKLLCEINHETFLFASKVLV